MKVRAGRINIPVFAILAAVPAAVKAFKAKAADDRSPSSPGGAKVTAGEFLEDFGAFMGCLAEAALPAVAKANGIDVPDGLLDL